MEGMDAALDAFNYVTERRRDAGVRRAWYSDMTQHEIKCSSAVINARQNLDSLQIPRATIGARRVLA